MKLKVSDAMKKGLFSRACRLMDSPYSSATPPKQWEAEGAVAIA
jgi:hypothetical protein